MEEFKLIAKTFQGLEEVLAKELNDLDAVNVTPGRRMVSFIGDKEMMYRANFCLRTAVRVLKPIAQFKAKTADEVYEAVKAVDWEKYLTLDTSFVVDTVVYSEEFRHSKFVAYKVKDAIVDYYREKTGKRPNICVTNPDIKFNMHISDDDCTLSLDSSGESLHKRGYRVAAVESPINEVLAAGMIKMTGWDGQCDLIDPMCGSGTIAIEAALIARNIAPGVFHKNYAFEKWKDFDRDLLDKIYNDDSHERPFEHHIYAYDIDKNAVRAAQTNAKSAGVADEITITAQSIQHFKQPAEKSIMITNPPYGERISSPNLLGLYRTLGERLKHQFVGNDAWIIGYRKETFNQIGLKPSLTIPLYNGSLDCEFCKFQIFDGKLNTFRAQGGVVKTDEERERNFSKRKLKPHREFIAQEVQDDDADSEIPEYLIRRHREFVQSQQREARRRSDEGGGREGYYRNNDSDNRRERGNNGRYDTKKDYAPPRERRFGGDDRINNRGRRKFDGGRSSDRSRRSSGQMNNGVRNYRNFNHDED